MENRENPVFGRKIFFLGPTLKLKNTIISHLRQMEYEVYEIESYKNAKPVLAENENAICFIVIDNELSFKEWFNFVKSFEYDFSLKGIFLGVLSGKATSSGTQQFLLKTKLPCGMLDLNENATLLFDRIVKILDINGAKGRRKYVRLDCFGMKSVYASVFIQGRMIDFQLDDLSSAGFAANCSKKFMPFIQKGAVVGITLHIGVKDLVVDCVVYAVKENESTMTCVFVFSPSVDEKVKVYIRSFVFSTLQNKMNTFILSNIEDQTDYSKEIEVPEEEVNPLISPDDNHFQDDEAEMEVLPVLGELDPL